MIRQLFNWRTGITLIAVEIVSGTIFYSTVLANHIDNEDIIKVYVFVMTLIIRA